MKRIVPVLLLLMFVASAQAQTPHIGATVQTWHYDSYKKLLTIRVVNTSDKDITAYDMSVVTNYVNGTKSFAEMTHEFLPLITTVATHQELADKYGNGTFAARTSRDDVIHEAEDVKDVLAVVDVVVYSDQNADVLNKRAFSHISATRKGMLVATQTATSVMKQSLSNPDAKDAATKELTRLADVAKGRKLPPSDPDGHIEMTLRELAMQASQAGNLADIVKDADARIAVMANHVNLVEVQP